MTPNPHCPVPPRLRCGSHNGRAGLTLVEVMVSCAMICLTCTSFMFVFTQLNQMAMIARLYTGAGAVAQNQIDLISTQGPFQPQNSTVAVPAVLTPGTATATVQVYQDPLSGNTINGTMTTTVATANSSVTTGSVTDTLYLYQATVTVTYQYRNRSYSVSFSTLRTSDV
jgi:type II secretory pathway pseudopilin PulG